MRFAALGDSITVGYGDPMPGRRWRGWAKLLAEALGADLYNFASSGALTRDVARVQLPRAIAVRPDVAAVVVGVNDTLRDTFDPVRIGRMLDHTVAALRERGATVLTARLPDPGRMFGLPGVLARPLGRRIRAVNAAADVVAARYGTLHLDVAEHPSTYDSLMWSVDRLHPSERGHRFLATSYFDLLAAHHALPAGRRPGTEPLNPEPTMAAKALWMATAGTMWVIDRSTDLVPSLLKMAYEEWRSGVRATAPAHALLDAPMMDSPTGFAHPHEVA
jgi:lysophospholipase L1-like esterase